MPVVNHKVTCCRCGGALVTNYGGEHGFTVCLRNLRKQKQMAIVVAYLRMRKARAKHRANTSRGTWKATLEVWFESVDALAALKQALS